MMLLLNTILNYMARSNEFMRTMKNPEKRIGMTIWGKNQKIFEENGDILWAISKGLEFLGKQGIIGLTQIKLFRRRDKATFSGSI